MTIEEIIDPLPIELKLVVIDQMVHARKVHFLKLFKYFNGGLYNQPHDFPGMFGNGEPGVEQVSPLSGATKVAKWSRAIQKAATQVSRQNLTPIAVNPPVFPINTPKPGVPHIKVDMVDDVFCVSSNGQYPFFTGEQFSGGVVLWHAKLKAMHRICRGLPNFDLAARNYGCQDCGRNYHADPSDFPGDNIEFCTRCIGLWFARLRNLEQVYIIVPGLPRADRTDKQYISRYGETATNVQAFTQARQEDPTCRCVGVYDFDVDTGNFAGLVAASRSIEAFGTDGPISFEGDGITLYEVAYRDVPDRAVRFMNTLLRAYASTLEHEVTIQKRWLKKTNAQRMLEAEGTRLEARLCI
ncbi:hypothetical protein LA080_004351 [Diaporthe eres]|nr:hypothetical protein LA080_004351 [Diaporthe eres]